MSPHPHPLPLFCPPYPLLNLKDSSEEIAGLKDIIIIITAIIMMNGL
jgi:hypothetical protein